MASGIMQEAWKFGMNVWFQLMCSNALNVRMYYNGPSLSSHSHQRPPYNVATIFLSQLLQLHLHVLLPLATGHLSNVATISWQTGWPC